MLEQPWDGLVGGPVSPESTSSCLLVLDSPELDQVMDRLEKDLGFLLMADGSDPPKDRQERLKKALDLTDDQEFRAVLSNLRSIQPAKVTRELTERIGLQKSRKASSLDPSAARAYLTDVSSIRAHFRRFKETAVPRVRLQLWAMLSRALIQYERILRGKSNHQTIHSSVGIESDPIFFAQIDCSWPRIS